MSIHEGAVSPFAVSLMLTCYWSPEPVTERAQEWSTEAGVEITAWLAAQGLIDPKTYRATERGKAWVEFICATPLPVAKWTLPEREPTLARAGVWLGKFIGHDQPEQAA
jgi:hypothetical protein